MNKTDKILQLIEKMKYDAEYWDDEDTEDIDLEEKYSERVQELRRLDIVKLLFPHYQVRHLVGWVEQRNPTNSFFPF